MDATLAAQAVADEEEVDAKPPPWLRNLPWNKDNSCHFDAFVVSLLHTLRSAGIDTLPYKISDPGFKAVKDFGPSRSIVRFMNFMESTGAAQLAQATPIFYDDYATYFNRDDVHSVETGRRLATGRRGAFASPLDWFSSFHRESDARYSLVGLEVKSLTRCNDPHTYQAHSTEDWIQWRKANPGKNQREFYESEEYPLYDRRGVQESLRLKKVATLAVPLREDSMEVDLGAALAKVLTDKVSRRRGECPLCLKAAMCHISIDFARVLPLAVTRTPRHERKAPLGGIVFTPTVFESHRFEPRAVIRWVGGNHFTVYLRVGVTDYWWYYDDLSVGKKLVGPELHRNDDSMRGEINLVVCSVTRIPWVIK